MKDKNEIRNTLKAKRAFIYKIKDEYYYIGKDIFRKCIHQELETYNEYTKQINIINNLGYLPEHKEDLKNLYFYFDKIWNIKEENNNNKDMEKFFEKLSNQDIKNLESQIENLEKVLDFKDKAFYRHSQK
jgi:hypothetical protein